MKRTMSAVEQGEREEFKRVRRNSDKLLVAHVRRHRRTICRLERRKKQCYCRRKIGNAKERSAIPTLNITRNSSTVVNWAHPGVAWSTAAAQLWGTGWTYLVDWTEEFAKHSFRDRNKMADTWENQKAGGRTDQKVVGGECCGNGQRLLGWERQGQREWM